MNTLSHPRTKRLAPWAAALAITFAAANLPAAPPSTINYQGQLTRENGTPVNGTTTMTFSLYEAPEGGTPIWTEVQHDVNVDMGLFSVALGTVAPFADHNVDFSKPYFLEIELEGETFSPKVPLRSTPYALRALTVHDGAVDSPQLADGAVTANKLNLLANDLTMQTIDGLPDALAGKLSLAPEQSPVIDIADDQADTQLEITNSADAMRANLHVEGRVQAAEFVGDGSQLTNLAAASITGSRTASFIADFDTAAQSVFDAKWDGKDTDTLAEGAGNLYYTDARVAAQTDVAANSAHRAKTDNPHNVTAEQIGLILGQLASKDAVESPDIEDGTVAAADLQDGSVTNAKIAADAEIDVSKVAGLGEALAGKLSLVPEQSPVIDIADDQADTHFEITNSADAMRANLHVEGRVQAAEFVGDGSQLTNLSAASITGSRTASFIADFDTAAQSVFDAKWDGRDTDALAEGAGNLYYTDARVAAQDDVAANSAHRAKTDNPHNVTAAQLGLGKVLNEPQLVAANNLSDLDDLAAARSNLGLQALAFQDQITDAQIADDAAIQASKIDGLPDALTGKLSLAPEQSPVIDIADDQADTQLEITNSHPDKQANLHVEGDIVAGGKVLGHNTPTMVQEAFTGIAPHDSLIVEHAPDPDMRRVVQVYFEKNPFGDESDGEVLVDANWQGPVDEMGNPMLDHDLNATTLTVKTGTTLNTAGHAIHATGTVTVEASATITDLVTGGQGGHPGMGGYGGSGYTYPADPGQPGQPGEDSMDQRVGKGGHGGGGGGGGAAQTANATSIPGGRGGDGGHGGQGGGIVILYCNQLQVEDGGLLHANGIPGESGQDGQPGQHLSGTDHSAASGGGGGGAGGDGGSGGIVDILVAQPLDSALGERIQALGGAGGAGGNGGSGLDTTLPIVGMDNDNGWGKGANGGGDGGGGEAGEDASGSGEPGADGVDGSPGVVQTFVWEGQQRVLADSREFRVLLSQNRTTIRNETGESFDAIWVNILLPSTTEQPQ